MTPQINEGDSVVMDIVQEVSVPQQVLSASDVITNSAKLKRSACQRRRHCCPWRQRRYSGPQQGVPLLSDIPGLGDFSAAMSCRYKSNLLVFIRSAIIRDDATSLARRLKNTATFESNNVSAAIRGCVSSMTMSCRYCLLGKIAALCPR